jgi:hypothetical protein
MRRRRVLDTEFWLTAALAMAVAVVVVMPWLAGLWWLVRVMFGH